MLPFGSPGAQQTECATIRDGGLWKHHFENHDLVTERGSQLVDVTGGGSRRGRTRRRRERHGARVLRTAHDLRGQAQSTSRRAASSEDFLRRRLPSSRPRKAATTAHRDDLDIRTEGPTTTTCTRTGTLHLRAGILSSSSQTILIVDGALDARSLAARSSCELGSLSTAEDLHPGLSGNDHDGWPHDRSRRAATGRSLDPAFGRARESSASRHCLSAARHARHLTAIYGYARLVDQIGD